MSMVQDAKTTVVAKNLPTQWNDDSIKSVFAQFGSVAAVTYPAVKKQRANAAPRTTKTAFIRFDSEADVQKACETSEFDFNDEENNCAGKFTISKFEVRPPREPKARVAKAPKAAQPKAASSTTAAKKTKAKKPTVGENAFAVVAKGFDASLTKADISNTFANFGTVSKVILTKRSFNKRNPVAKTTAFIVFAAKEDVEKALQVPAFDLEVGQVKCNITVTRFEYKERPAPKTAPKNQKKTKKAAKKTEPANTVVVRGIPVAFTEDEVKAAVSTIGAVEAIRFVGVREKSQFKVAYVLMATPETAAAALTAAEVAAKDVKLSIVAYSTERPTDLRVVVTRIPLSYTTEQIEALAKQFGEAQVTLFQPRVVEGQAPVRTAQTAMFRYTTQDQAKAALAKKSFEYKTEAGEDALMLIRGYRFNNKRRRAPQAAAPTAQ